MKPPNNSPEPAESGLSRDRAELGGEALENVKLPPDAGERILRIREQEFHHQQGIDRQKQKRADREQVIGVAAFLIGMALAVITFFFDHKETAATLFGATMIGFWLSRRK